MLEFYVANESLSLDNPKHFFLFELDMEHGIRLLYDDLEEEQRCRDSEQERVQSIREEITLMEKWHQEGIKGVVYIREGDRPEKMFKVCDPERPIFDDFYLQRPNS